jgi:hypothetical protein
MSRKNVETRKSAKTQITTNNRVYVKPQSDEPKQIPSQQNTNSVAASFESASKVLSKLKPGSSGKKQAIPSILSAGSNRDDAYNNAYDSEQDLEIMNEGSLPLKLFDGKKQSLSELSEQSMSYLWLRRIKEIFLRMSDGNDEQDDDPFVEFDMNLAKTDLGNTCDRYIENERLTLTKKVI